MHRRGEGDFMHTKDVERSRLTYAILNSRSYRPRPRLPQIRLAAAFIIKEERRRYPLGDDDVLPSRAAASAPVDSESCGNIGAILSLHRVLQAIPCSGVGWVSRYIAGPAHFRLRV